MTEATSKPSRRGFFIGAGAAGVAGAALVSLRTAPTEAVAEVDLKPPPEKGGGYSLSEHVKSYYKTARV